MTVAQLKKELGDRGLDATGLKAALVARLEEALASGGPAGDAEMDAGDAPAATAAEAPREEAKPAEKEDDVVSLDAGDALGDAPPIDGDDEPSSEKKKEQTAGGSPVRSIPAEGLSRRELEKERKKSGACLFCGSMDHKGSDCPDRIAKMFCHICGNKGHKHADCPQRVDAPENGCVLCGAAEHGVFNCPQKKIDPDKPEPRARDASRGMTCAICKKQGHVKRDCPDRTTPVEARAKPQDPWCFVCGTRATHKQFECPSAVKTEDKSSCFVCGSREHRAFACPAKKLDPEAKCGICGKPGHERRNCPEKPAEDVSKLFCFVCGEIGHKRLECPSRIPEADVPENGCIICGAAEHTMHKCPKKKVDPNAPARAPRQEKRKRDDDGGRGDGRGRSAHRGRDRSRDRGGYDRGGYDRVGYDRGGYGGGGYGGGGYGGGVYDGGGYGGAGRFDDHDHRRPRQDSHDRYGGGGYGNRDDYRPTYRRDDSRDGFGGGGPRYDSRNYASGGGGGEQLCRDFQRGTCTRPGCRFKHAGGGGGGGLPRGGSHEKRRSPPR